MVECSERPAASSGSPTRSSSIVEDDGALRRQGSGLLIGKIGIADRRQPDLVAIPEHSPQLLARDDGLSRYHQSRVTQIDEAATSTPTSDVFAPPAEVSAADARIQRWNHPTSPGLSTQPYRSR